MALKERIAAEMKAALLSGNRFVGETLRGLKAAILDEEVSTGRRDEGLSDTEIEKIVAREIKKRHESAKIYRENNRPELAEPEEKEAAILQSYLPQQLSEQALQKIIDEAISKLSVSGMQNMGKVIGLVKTQVGNTADGALIAKLVKNRLTE